METTHSGFWTIEGMSPSDGPITFCESHALSATNEAFRIYGLDPAESMNEAANVCAMIAALSGKDAELFTYSDTGVCAQCKEESNKRTGASLK